MLDLKPIKKRCEAATSGPWHYWPCGEKSNDCLLGVAVGEAESGGEDVPPPGRVDPHPYNEETGEFEMHKYIFDPSIAYAENHADYDDFAFMAHARTDIPALIAEVERLRKQLAEKSAAQRSDDNEPSSEGSD